jgi:chlorite dismutase
MVLVKKWLVGKKEARRPITVTAVTEAPAVPQRVTFVGGRKGVWKVTGMETINGHPLEKVQRLEVVGSLMANVPREAKWLLRGVTSSERYTTRREHQKLIARQPELGRPEATYAALIPITKSASWWNLSQDERRRIFETQSGHIRTGLKHVPAIARRLYHCRDIGEPFDFLTWFEFAPSSESRFNDLVAKLRKTEEWNYVEREVDIRLILDKPPKVGSG